ncbi:hypothetical protein KCP77_16415 [Salmonella enterica subsp. enterica]|nr:hypothetical protein KCP77_16415 [Salmonella enterica subsp. enterica]
MPCLTLVRRLPCGTSGRMVRVSCAKEAKIQPSGYLCYEHNIWTTPQRVAARGEAHWNPVLFTRRINCGCFTK